MSQINNLNIFTFIKDIYQSLKHIDKYFSNFNESVNNRLIKIEDNQQILIDKIANIENILVKISEIKNNNVGLDKNLEIELMKKMNMMNDSVFKNDVIDLKPEELTIANILENNYSFLDINESLEKYNLGNNNLDNNNLDNNNLDNNISQSYISILKKENNKNKNKNENETENETKTETLDNLLF